MGTSTILVFRSKPWAAISSRSLQSRRSTGAPARSSAMYRIVADAAIFTATLPRIFTYTNSGIWLPSIGDRGNKRENRKLYAPTRGRNLKSDQGGSCDAL